MTRRLFNVLTTLSMALLLATAGLWARSHSGSQSAELTLRGERWRVSSDSGTLAVDNTPQRLREKREWAAESERVRRALQRYDERTGDLSKALARYRPRGWDEPESPEEAALLDELYRLRREIKPTLDQVARVRQGGLAPLTLPWRWTPPKRHAVPHAVPAAAAAVLPAAWAVRALRDHRRRQRHGLCRACGYDLRATPERCPECGFVPEAQPTR